MSVHVPPPGTDAVRLPPHSAEMEASLLGSILLNNSVMEVVAPLVKVEDFVEEIHRRIFEVAAAMISAGQAANPVTMRTFLGEHDLGGITVPRYLARLAADEAAPLSARSFAIGIHDLAVRRRMIEAAEELVERAHDLPVTVRPSQVAGEAAEILFKLAGEEGARSTRRDAFASAGATMDRIQNVALGEIEEPPASTGFRDLDEATAGGFVAGDLWVVGARPGVGKTVFAVTSANKVARRGDGVLFFSLEVAERQIIARVLSDLAFTASEPVEYREILRSQSKPDVLSPTQLGRLAHARELLAQRPLVLDVASRLSPMEIRLRVRAERQRMAARGIELKVVFIDYLKQIAASSRYAGNRVQEIGEISYSLKQLAKDEGVCVVLLAQLNRALENRDDKRPVLADIRDSGDLEADADVVAFLHREAHHILTSEAYRREEPEAISRYLDHKYEAEVILGKVRAGSLVQVKLWCNMACSTMSDHARG